MAVTVLAGDHIVSSDTIPTLKRSLSYIGSGVTRSVYDLGNGTVLKVGAADSEYGGNETEVACWEACEGTELGNYLAPIVAYDSESYAWIIMRKVDGVIGDDSAARAAYYDSDACYVLESSNINDLHHANIGYVYNEDEDSYSFYAIDYAMSGDAYSHCETCCARSNNGCEWHSWEGRDSACCGSARFASHDCSFLKGCQVYFCDAPNCNNYADRKIRTLMHLEQGWRTHAMEWRSDVAIVCNVHRPRNVASINWERENLHLQMALPLMRYGTIANPH